MMLRTINEDNILETIFKSSLSLELIETNSLQEKFLKCISSKYSLLFYFIPFFIIGGPGMQLGIEWSLNNEVIVPIFGYNVEWWMRINFDWWIKAYGCSIVSVIPIFFITMTQSFLNKHVKALA